MNQARAALRRRHSWIAGAGAMILFVGLSAPARAEPARRVVLVVPGAIGPIATEALTRVRGELQAARFEVVTEVVAADVDRRATVEREVRKGNARAAFGIFFGTGVAEIWVTDAVSGRTAVQMLPLDAAAPERRAAVLAVKAVDLLKATLAEIWIGSPLAPLPTASPTPATTALPASPAPEPVPPAPEVRHRSADDGTTSDAGAVTVRAEESEPSPPPLVSRFEIAAGPAGSPPGAPAAGRRWWRWQCSTGGSEGGWSRPDSDRR